MRTVVLSDLHLSTASGSDVLRQAAPRRTLMARVAGADRVVLLGDVIELREGPLGEAVAEAEPFFRDLGAALGDAKVTIVPGNHDNRLAAPVIAAVRQRDGNGLELDSTAPAPQTGPLARIAQWLQRAELEIAYPGVWLREDVYATHGHYMDCHVTVPTFERLAVAVTERAIGGLPPGARTPDDYESALRPLYSLSHSFAQASGMAGLRRRMGNGVSAGIWEQLGAASGARRDTAALAVRAIGGVLPAAVAGLNRVGLGPFEPDITGQALRRSGLAAMRTVCERLGIDAEHVIFGHTHRSGPWSSDDEAEWRLPGGGHLTNSGSWVHAPAFLGPQPRESPYWPGTAVTIEDAGPPRLERLLGDLPPTGT